MTDPKVIPLQPDQTKNEIEGGPPQLTPAGDLEIDAVPGNPDETVKLDTDMVDDKGVEIASEVEAEFNPAFKPTTNDGENHD